MKRSIRVVDVALGALGGPAPQAPATTAARVRLGRRRRGLRSGGGGGRALLLRSGRGVPLRGFGRGLHRRRRRLAGGSAGGGPFGRGGPRGALAAGGRAAAGLVA